MKFIFKSLLISRSVDPSLIYVFVLRKLSLKRIVLLLKDHKTVIGLYETIAPQYKLTLSPIPSNTFPVDMETFLLQYPLPYISGKLRFDKFSAQCDEISFGLDLKSLHRRLNSLTFNPLDKGSSNDHVVKKSALFFFTK